MRRRVIDQDTGKPYYLDFTDELLAEVEAHHRSNCDHAQTEIRRRKNRGGAFLLQRQCIACGASVGSAIKQTPDLRDCPAWTEGQEDRYIASRSTALEAIYQRHVRKQKEHEGIFGRKYDAYLKSPEWQARRAKVMGRANGLCEGCLERKATQVHHQTYEHIFEEFMFELVAVCDECHARLHPEKEGDGVIFDFEAEWHDGHPCDGCRHGGEEKNRRWCFILDKLAADALLEGGGCGPNRDNFEALR